MRAAVDDVELGSVAARVEAVGADAGRDVADLLEVLAINQIDAVGHHVGDKECLAVRRDADVLRHAAANPDIHPANSRVEQLPIRQLQRGLGDQICPVQVQMADDLALDHVDLDQATAAELAGEDRVFAVDREIRQRLLQCHLDGIAKIETLEPLGDDDRGTAIQREVEVVGILHRDRLAGLAGLRIDRGQAALRAPQPVVVDPQRLQIPGRDDVLRLPADPISVDDLERLGVDHIDVVGAQIGHVDARQRVGDGRAQLVAADLAVKVRRVRDRRHAGQQIERRRIGARRPDAQAEREAQPQRAAQF